MHNPTLIRETQLRLYALYDKGKIKPVIIKPTRWTSFSNLLNFWPTGGFTESWFLIQFPLKPNLFPQDPMKAYQIREMVS